jgi:hypothetical protein
MVQEGPLWETVAHEAGSLWGNHSKAQHTPIVNLCNDM